MGDKGDSYSYYFYVALFASVLVGMASATGEATFLGFINGYPSHTVGYVSSGTGFAGLSGTGTLLLLKGFGLSNQMIFLVSIPTYLVYYFCAYWLNKQKKAYPFIDDRQTSDQ